MALVYSASRLEDHNMYQMNEHSHGLDVHNTDENTPNKILMMTGNAEDQHTTPRYTESTMFSLIFFGQF